jgi:hypothetical protein
MVATGSSSPDQVPPYLSLGSDTLTNLGSYTYILKITDTNSTKDESMVSYHINSLAEIAWEDETGLDMYKRGAYGMEDGGIQGGCGAK